MRRDKHGSTRPRTWNILSKNLRSMHSKNTTSCRWHPTYDIYNKQKRWRRTLWELTCSVLQRLCSCKAAVIEGKRFFATFLKTFKTILPSRIFCYVIHVLEYIIAFTLLCFTHPEHLGNFTKTDKQIPLSIKHQTTRI